MNAPLLETNSSEVQLVFIDLDGTLVGKTDTASPRNIAAIREAQSRGVVFVLSTGRIPFMAEPIAAQIGRTGYGIFSNGSIIMDWSTNKVLRAIPVPSAIARRGAEIALSRGIAPLFFGVDMAKDLGRAVYADPRVPLAPSYLERNAHRVTYTDLLSPDFDREPTTVEFFGDHDSIFGLDAAMRAEFGGAATLYTAHLHRYGVWLVGLNGPGVSKAVCAQIIADKLGIAHPATMAIGDQSNDIELLQWASLGVCMADGSEEALAAADYITAAFDEDGVAQALERFILN